MTTNREYNVFLELNHKRAKEREEFNIVEQELTYRVANVLLSVSREGEEGIGKELFEEGNLFSSQSIEAYRWLGNRIYGNFDGDIEVGGRVLLVSHKDMFAAEIEYCFDCEILGGDTGFAIQLERSAEEENIDATLAGRKIEENIFFVSKSEVLRIYDAKKVGKIATLFDNFYNFLSLVDQRVIEAGSSEEFIVKERGYRRIQKSSGEGR